MGGGWCLQGWNSCFYSPVISIHGANSADSAGMVSGVGCILDLSSTLNRGGQWLCLGLRPETHAFFRFH